MRKISCRGRLLAKLIVFRITDNPHDLKVSRFIVASKTQNPSEWIAIPKRLFCESLIDHGDFWTRGVIVFVQNTTAERRNTQRGKVSGPDHMSIKIKHLLACC